MKRKEDVVLQSVAGQDLLVPVGARVADMNGMVVLNPTGRFLWELLAEDRSLDDLVTALADQFDVDKERVRGDVRGFLDELTRWRLLEP